MANGSDRNLESKEGEEDEGVSDRGILGMLCRSLKIACLHVSIVETSRANSCGGRLDEIESPICDPKNGVGSMDLSGSVMVSWVSGCCWSASYCSCSQPLSDTNGQAPTVVASPDASCTQVVRSFEATLTARLSLLVLLEALEASTELLLVLLVSCSLVREDVECAGRSPALRNDSSYPT